MTIKTVRNPNLSAEDITILYQEIDRLVVSGTTGIKLWRKIIELGVRYNPTIAYDMRFIAQRNADERAKLKDQKYGESDEGGYRHAISVPVSIWYLLKHADPTIGQNPKDLVSLHKAFQQFRVSEKV